MIKVEWSIVAWYKTPKHALLGMKAMEKLLKAKKIEITSGILVWGSEATHIRSKQEEK